MLSPWRSPIGALVPPVCALLCFWQRLAYHLSTSHGDQAGRVRSGGAEPRYAPLLAALQHQEPSWGSLARRPQNRCKMACSSRAAAAPCGPQERCPCVRRAGKVRAHATRQPRCSGVGAGGCQRQRKRARAIRPLRAGRGSRNGRQRLRVGRHRLKWWMAD